MGSSFSREEILSEMDITIATLNSTRHFIKRKATQQQIRLYKELERRFRAAYELYLDKYGQTYEIEERLTLFSRANLAWQKAANPETFQLPLQ